MNGQSKIEIILTAYEKGLTEGMRRAKDSLRSFATESKVTEARVKGLATSFSGQLLPMLGRIGPAIVAAVGAMAASKVTAVGREFDKLSAGLETATGSAEGAVISFAALEEFAANTPYDLAQVTEAFTKLVNFGLSPSEEALTSYGDTASAMGKSLNQMIEAVADATTGEFERLKEFGIKAKSEGDQVTFTFRGLSTTVGKNAAEIEQYLIKLGQTNFGGAMQRQMTTLDGAISNLGDSWNKLFRTIANNGIGRLIETSVRAATSALDQISAAIDAIGRRFRALFDDLSSESVGNAMMQIGGSDAWNPWMADDTTAVRIKYLSDQAAAAQQKIEAIKKSVAENPDDYDIHWETRVKKLQESIADYNAELAKLQSTSAQVKEKTGDRLAQFGNAPEDVVAKQAAALKAAWKSYEDNLKSATTQMDAAKSAGELSLAKKALEYEQQGMDKREAEIKLTREKLALIDQEIAKYSALKASIPTGDSEGKSSQDAAAELEQKINGLRVERVGLLRQEVEGNRAAAKERETNHKKELEDLQKLNAEKLRFVSQEKILAMELERLEAAKLPTALARAEAELAIDRRVMVERISLKKQELAALKAAEKVDAADVLNKEGELAELRTEAVKQEYQNLAQVAREKLAETEQAWRRGAGSVEEYRAAVVAAKNEGVIFADEMNERLIASGDNLGAALSLGFQRAREKMQTDAEMMIYIGENVGEIVAGGLVSAWDAVTDRTKTAKEAVIDFARSTLNWLSQIILKQMLLNALQSASSMFGGAAMADGGSVQALAGGGSVAGWSPSPTADNIPAWLTAREFVQPVRAVDYYGEAFMESIRRLRFPRSLAHALAGGTLPRIPSGSRLAQGGMPAAGPATTVKGGDTKLRVINVLDKNMVGDYLRTSDGETAIINMIRRNGTTIRTLIGG